MLPEQVKEWGERISALPDRELIILTICSANNLLPNDIKDPIKKVIRENIRGELSIRGEKIVMEILK